MRFDKLAITKKVSFLYMNSNTIKKEVINDRLGKSVERADKPSSTIANNQKKLARKMESSRLKVMKGISCSKKAMVKISRDLKKPKNRTISALSKIISEFRIIGSSYMSTGNMNIEKLLQYTDKVASMETPLSEVVFNIEYLAGIVDRYLTSYPSFMEAYNDYINFRATLVSENIGLVMSVARKYSANLLSDEDIFQVGVIGLIKAVDKYDISTDNAFSTVATLWIRQAISREVINNNSLIKHSEDNLRRNANINNAINELEANQISVTDSNIAKHTGLSSEKVYELRKSCSHKRVMETDHNEAGHNYIDAIAVDQPDEAEIDSQKERLLEMINTLPADDAHIIIRHYGLGDAEPMTKIELSCMYDTTPHKITYILSRSMESLREKYADELYELLS